MLTLFSLILIRTGRWPHGIVGTIHSAPLLHYGQKAEVTTRRGVGQRGGGGEGCPPSTFGMSGHDRACRASAEGIEHPLIFTLPTHAMKSTLPTI